MTRWQLVLAYLFDNCQVSPLRCRCVRDGCQLSKITDNGDIKPHPVTDYLID